VLFDGVCNLCNASIDFIIRRDRLGKLHFASLQGVRGRALKQQYAIPAEFTDNIVLIENGEAHHQSTAVLRIARHMNWPWNWTSWLTIIPAPVRDALYMLIARRRYRWFGRRETCRIPTPAERSRFE